MPVMIAACGTRHCHNGRFNFELLMKTTPKRWQFTRLSQLQISQLCILATRAHKAARARHHPDAELNAEDWRKRGQDEATGIQGLSLREATQEHYLPIRGYWWVIIGNAEQAFYDFMNSGVQNEISRQLQWRLAGEVCRLAEGIAAEKLRLPIPVQIDDEQATKQALDYMQALSKDAFNGRRAHQLNAAELERLCFTVFNRASAKLGVGDSSTRNKSQRRKKKAAKNAPEEPLETRSRTPQTPAPSSTTTSSHRCASGAIV